MKFKLKEGAILALFLLFISCSRKDYRFEEGMAWNTAYHITYESDRDLSDSIILVLNEINSSLSPFNPQSVVSGINENISDSVDRHFIAVYNESVKINEATNGTFDPTLAPLIRAWGFEKGHEVSADTMRLDSLLLLVGIAKTKIESGALIKKNKEIEFNFSALAKGYGVDCIADMLQNNGVTNYLVEIGGEIRASGVNPDGKFWRIGIDKPDSEARYGETMELIEVNNVALATSGNYRNFHETEGRRFGHTISSKTGRPVETDVISATVIASSCMEADALATSCMALGSEKALSLCSRLSAGVMLILSDFSVVRNDLFPN